LETTLIAVVNLPQHYCQGAFGIVLLEVGSFGAIKIFKNDILNTERPIKVFNAEVAAYEIIMINSHLQQHTPKFYGRVKVSKILDHTGVDVSNEYMLDFCYQIHKSGTNPGHPNLAIKPQTIV